MGKPKASKAKAQIVPKNVAGTMQDLIGNSVDIALPDGGLVIVPTEKSGNRVANMILAAQIRHLIQDSIKVYREKEMLPTPKDLKDLAEAAKSLHNFSGEVYKEDDAQPIASSQKQVKDEAETSEVDFDIALEEKKPE